MPIVPVRQSPSGRRVPIVALPIPEAPNLVPVTAPDDYIIVPLSANLVVNDSSIPGASVKDALDAIDIAIAALAGAIPVGVTIDLSGLNAPIPATNIFPTTPLADIYLVCLYVQVTTASGTGTVQVTIRWTDEDGLTNQSTTMFLGAIGRSRQVVLVRTNGSSNVTYEAGIGGAIASAQFRININARKA